MNSSDSSNSILLYSMWHFACAFCRIFSVKLYDVGAHLTVSRDEKVILTAREVEAVQQARRQLRSHVERAIQAVT